MKKTVLALTLAVAFMFVASISSAAVNVLAAGQSTTCEKAGWVATNQDEKREHAVGIQCWPDWLRLG